MEDGTSASVILAGSTRSRSAARARGFRQPHQLHGRTHAKRTQKFVFQGAKRFNLPRQFRGLRDFGSSVNTRLLRQDQAVQNPRIIIDRSRSLLPARPLASGKLITLVPAAEPESEPSVQVLRGGDPVQQAAKAEQKQTDKPAWVPAPVKEYDFSAY